MVRWLMGLVCKRYGHRWFWHYLGYPGDGRTCWRCGRNQSWADYWATATPTSISDRAHAFSYLTI